MRREGESPLPPCYLPHRRDEKGGPLPTVLPPTQTRQEGGKPLPAMFCSYRCDEKGFPPSRCVTCHRDVTRGGETPSHHVLFIQMQREGVSPFPPCYLPHRHDKRGKPLPAMFCSYRCDKKGFPPSRCVTCHTDATRGGNPFLLCFVHTDATRRGFPLPAILPSTQTQQEGGNPFPLCFCPREVIPPSQFSVQTDVMRGGNPTSSFQLPTPTYK